MRGILTLLQHTPVVVSLNGQLDRYVSFIWHSGLLSCSSGGWGGGVTPSHYKILVQEMIGSYLIFQVSIIIVIKQLGCWIFIWRIDEVYLQKYANTCVEFPINMHYLQPLKKYPFISNASYLNKGVTLRARSSEDGLHYLYLASGQWFSSLLRYIAAGS